MTSKQFSTLVTPPSTGVTEYDTVVIGATLAGLVAAALLSRNGAKVLLVEESDEIGGKWGNPNYHGYWLEGGHRDARDCGDYGVVTGAETRKVLRIFEAAGANVNWSATEASYKVHRMAEGKITLLDQKPETQAEFATEIVGVPPDKLRAYFDFLDNLRKENSKKLTSVSFKEYLAGREQWLIDGMMRLATIQFSIPAEETSVGRWIEFIKEPLEVHRVNEPDVGGTQALLNRLADVIRKNGGSIELGLKPVEITVEDNAARGIVTMDKACVIQLFRAPTVVFAEPAWHLFKIMDESLFPADMVANANRLEQWVGDNFNISMGLSRLPIVRATGKPEDYQWFNRLLATPEKGYYSGGFMLYSETSQGQAPRGKVYLCITFGTSGPLAKGFEPFNSFAGAKAKIDVNLEYARRYYQDLDEITEWKVYNWAKAHSVTFLFKTLPRMPLEVPTVNNLYLAGVTTEAEGQFEEVECNAAKQAADLILKALKKTD